jgi:catechol 2,3-dioxygenase-like lactoylglutathione lyase family enzyme
MYFLHVRLHAPARSLPALADFYGASLGMPLLEQTPASSAVAVGETRLEFLASPVEPFYHFALLAPGNRFDEVLEWVTERTELLPDRDTGEVVFDFANWAAKACYFHDPAGNIVELIAHRGIGETRAQGSFAAGELLGVSELGLVGDPAAIASVLAHRLGLELWDGTIEVEGRLAFVGERARTLILCPAGRPWLPTGRPAEAHPVDVVVSGSPEAEASIAGALYRIRRGTTNDVETLSRTARRGGLGA